MGLSWFFWYFLSLVLLDSILGRINLLLMGVTVLHHFLDTVFTQDFWFLIFCRFMFFCFGNELCDEYVFSSFIIIFFCFFFFYILNCILHVVFFSLYHAEFNISTFHDCGTIFFITKYLKYATSSSLGIWIFIFN